VASATSLVPSTARTEISEDSERVRRTSSERGRAESGRKRRRRLSFEEWRRQQTLWRRRLVAVRSEEGSGGAAAALLAPVVICLLSEQLDRELEADTSARIVIAGELKGRGGRRL
jgi:hypothetical protein